ncbi:dual specificity protein phosphatase 12-like isoform X1 [Mangifera indica]|uniref:dual specificity protein phosphatase 12-like isoform X1 n=1 Tax=Mangifera indica TaxID=29780 RepID=UPI001CF9DB64|nr:dual specificity protein phosphatase 12-like isoform X1 [Mangifera indica]XP_044505580.1 dual specificity protein phosphatase 12-like isoform X1 [Mangifera indica]
MPYLVREHLFIGNIGDAAEVLQNGSNEITHILSVLSSASISFFSEWRRSLTIPTKEIKKVYVGEAGGDGSSTKDNTGDVSKSSLSREKLLYLLEYAGKDLKLVRMAVPIRDMEGENLLDYLDVCLDFIDRSRKEGSVLVHCFAGVSRSAAIITAYLMRTEQLSSEDALESLRQSCEFVCPNDGFLEQLKMFEEMGFKIDHASPIYKRFRLKVLGDSYNRGEKIDGSRFGADPGLPAEVSSVELTPNGDNHTRAYRCKKCRRVVALQENVVEHVPGEGETAFEWHKRSFSNCFNKSDESECSSIFVEPLRWMTTVEDGALEGKLSCVHCEARLGYFNWSGIQCSCGSWITPAFQLHKSRVDISTV